MQDFSNPPVDEWDVVANEFGPNLLRQLIGRRGWGHVMVLWTLVPHLVEG